MANQRSDFIQYNKHGLRVLLPNWMKIEQEGPKGVFAAERKNSSGIAIAIYTDDVERSGRTLESALRREAKTNPNIQRRLLRAGNIKVPYKGWESVVEVARERRSLGWDMILRPSSEVLLMVRLHWYADAKEDEHFWTRIMRSIKFDSAVHRKVTPKKSRVRKTKKVAARPMTLVHAIEEVLAKGGKQKSGVRVGRLKILLPTVETEPVSKPYAEVAEHFARRLVDGEFNAARNMLTPSLKRFFTTRQLKKDLASMHSYAKGPITSFEVMNTMEDWPAKQENDVGWAYVALTGDNFSEAVTVIVTKQASKLLIREIDWGRP